MPFVTCAVTGEQREAEVRKDGTPAVPKGGWKKAGGAFYSPKGWSQRFVLRTQTIAIASVVQGYDPDSWSHEATTEGWKAFREAFRTSTRAVQHLTNWLLSRLATLDNVAPVWTPREGKPGIWELGKFKPDTKALQQEAARIFSPVLDSQSIYTVFRKVSSKYLKSRVAIRGQHSETLPMSRFRLPIPIPVEAIARPVYFNDCRQAFIAIRLAGCNPFTLRLAGGPEWRRQLSALEGVAAGRLVQGELSLKEQVIMSGQRGNGGSSRHQTGGRGRTTRFMCGIPVWLPRGERTGDRTLLIRTDPASFLVAEIEDRGCPFILNCDNVARWHGELSRSGTLQKWIGNHRAYLQRISEDTKYEKRWPRHVKLTLNESRDRRCRKHAHRVKDAIFQMVASVVGYATRQGVGSVCYDDSNRSFSESFPWYMLASVLANKLDEAGIAHNIQAEKEESSTEACADGPVA